MWYCSIGKMIILIRFFRKEDGEMKAFFHKYKHSLVLLYAFVYMPWFIWLESRANLPYHVIHVQLDDWIPFLEGFIVPYLLWFVYVPAVLVYLFFQLQNKREFYQYCIFLFTGMTLFLIVSTIYPNGHLLRPGSFERHNIFTFAISILYREDTATNIFPSLHVYNSFAANIAIVNNQKLGKNIWIRSGSFLLLVSIILSTMFLKQHSVLDVISGILLGVLMEQLVYHTEFSFVHSRKRKPVGA